MILYGAPCWAIINTLSSNQTEQLRKIGKKKLEAEIENAPDRSIEEQIKMIETVKFYKKMQIIERIDREIVTKMHEICYKW